MVQEMGNNMKFHYHNYCCTINIIPHCSITKGYSCWFITIGWLWSYIQITFLNKEEFEL